MASVYLSAQSNAPGSSEIVLVNGTVATGYRLLNVDVGNPSFDKRYSGSRGTLGAVLAGENAQNRLTTFRLQAVGSSQDNLEAKLSTLWTLDEQLRRYGGRVTWRPEGGSFRMRITALDCGVALEALEPSLFVLNNRANVAFGVVSGPYYEGEPMDIYDGFFSDSEADYTFDGGSAADVSVNTSTHVLTASGNLTVEKRMIHTARGYSYGDHQISLLATPGATIASFKAGVVLKRLASNTYLEAYVDDNATNSRLRIDKVVTGSRTNLVSTNLAARIVNGTTFGLRARIEGNVVTAEYFSAVSIIPNPAAAATLTNTTTLTGGDITQFGVGVQGQAGLSWVPQVNTATLDDFDLRVFVRYQLTTPAVVQFTGLIPGDAPALGSIAISRQSGAADVGAALLGWWAQTPFTGQPDPLGIIEAETGSSLTSWASTADANYRGGTGLKWTTSGAGQASAQFNCDATNMVPDDYRDTIAVEVWGRFELANTLVSAVLQTSIYQATNTALQYAAEYGSAGKPVQPTSTAAKFRFLRLGTIDFPVGVMSTLVVVGTVAGGSSGQFGFDYLVLVPARARAASPSGKAASGYPLFLLGSGNLTKVVDPDLSAKVFALGLRTGGPGTGLGGSLIELPSGGIAPLQGLTGSLNILVKLSSIPFDQAYTNADTELLAEPATIELRNVRPRWRVARSS